MSELGYFPFGQPVLPVSQHDRSPKSVFVLGVYASAVHARWRDHSGRTLVSDLAVRSEPSIFWRGEDAAELVSQIPVSPGAGSLEPAAGRFNGPSGLALDQQFLQPLGISRDQAWLADLVPHSCANAAQKRALKRAYDPISGQLRLPAYSVPPVPGTLADDRRREELYAELQAADADYLILLGDQPIRWFLRSFEPRRRRLADFGTTGRTYGRAHEVDIHGRSIKVIPLAHPRQVAGLGRHSSRWRSLHAAWVRDVAGALI